MDQIVKYCINKKTPNVDSTTWKKRAMNTADFTQLLSLLFTENCTVTRANATSDELSVIYNDISFSEAHVPIPVTWACSRLDVFIVGLATGSTELMLTTM